MMVPCTWTVPARTSARMAAVSPTTRTSGDEIDPTMLPSIRSVPSKRRSPVNDVPLSRKPLNLRESGFERTGLPHDEVDIRMNSIRFSNEVEVLSIPDGTPTLIRAGIVLAPGRGNVHCRGIRCLAGADPGRFVMTTEPQSATELFRMARSGDDHALEQLFPLVYDELRALAGHYMRRENPRHTLQATALVHEAYLRLIPDARLQWNDRAHFLALIARSMRQILVDRARARNAEKRGGPDAHAVTLHDDLLGQVERSIDVLDLDRALEELKALDPRHAALVELRFFGGLTVEQCAEVLGVSVATVKRDWAFVRAWLRRKLDS